MTPDELAVRRVRRTMSFYMKCADDHLRIMRRKNLSATSKLRSRRRLLRARRRWLDAMTHQSSFLIFPEPPPKPRDLVESGIECAQAVIDNWEEGDLAGAINNLELWMIEARRTIGKSTK